MWCDSAIAASMPGADAADRFLMALARPDRQAIHDPLAVVVAHSDDETVGLGGQLPRLQNATIVHVTDSAPRDEIDARSHSFVSWRAYAAARRIELETAMAEAGIGTDRLVCLGVPDKEVVFHLVRLSERLAMLFDERRCEVVLTHAYEGGHSDHDATAFAVHAAVRLMEGRGPMLPSVIEMPYYHWQGSAFIAEHFADAVPHLALTLEGEALAMKRRMLAAHRSQAKVLVDFTSSVERFRRAPRYDFRAPANSGDAPYEKITQSIDQERWLALAGAALDELGLS